ncbi:nucleoside diphosphate kinase [Annulohypoxylon stygium]|nr:nucleoside diphosphate kinase [Annulohypoxylon stygium]
MTEMYQPQPQNVPKQFVPGGAGISGPQGGGGVSRRRHNSESHVKPNARRPNASGPQGPRHAANHPALKYLFFSLSSLCLVFFLFFLFPWTQPDRQGWTFGQSVQHDIDNYKGALFQSPSTLTITTTVTQSYIQPTEKPVPTEEVKMSTSEQTFIAIKPDGVQRGLVGAIISRFESRGFKLVALKLVTPGKAHLEQHYADLKDKPFFPGLIEYMNSGPIAAMVWEGLDAVKTGRTLLGATNPLASAPGTIRGDFALQTGRNVCHGSDSVENAKKEIALWFKEGDVISWENAQAKWIYE